MRRKKRNRKNYYGYKKRYDKHLQSYRQNYKAGHNEKKDDLRYTILEMRERAEEVEPGQKKVRFGKSEKDGGKRNDRGF